MAINVVSIHKLIRILERNVSILKTESRSSEIDFKFRDKLEYFDKLSCNMTDKLQSLSYLSENYAVAGNDLKQFTNKILGLWISIKKQIYEKGSKIRIASHTLSGVPLSLLLEKIKKERSLARESLYIHENEYDREHLEKCYVLLNEIDDLLSNLRRCEDKLQHYLAISKLIPFLAKLESVVDAYVSTIEISQTDKPECLKLDVSPIVVKLLTGELLGNESMDPYHVLMDNALRKPVFIIKTKRRTDISPVVETT